MSYQGADPPALDCLTEGHCWVESEGIDPECPEIGDRHSWCMYCGSGVSWWASD